MTGAATNPLIREAHQKTQDIDAKIQEFFENVNDVLSWVPGFFAHFIEPIQRGMEQLQQKVQEFWERVNQVFEQPGDPDRLKQVGEQWVNSIGNVLGDIAGTISLDKLRTNFEWTGSAAEAYKATVPAQTAGLDGLKDLAVQMRSSLSNLANSIDGFWLALKVAFGTFLIAMVGAVVAACTVVGIPAAIAVVLGAIGIAIGLITAAIVALSSHVNTIETEQATIRQEIHDLGDTWSKSNIGAMSDASVRDGDGSDWRVNE